MISPVFVVFLDQTR